MLAEKKPVFSSVLLQPHPHETEGIIFLPVLFFELWRKRNLRLIGQSAAAAAATAAVIILPFALHFGPLWIFRLFRNTLGEYPYASLNAFNFYSLLGANYVNDASGFLVFSYHTWGMIAITRRDLIDVVSLPEETKPALRAGCRAAAHGRGIHVFFQDA